MLDVGNTQAVLGVYHDEHLKRVYRVETSQVAAYLKKQKSRFRKITHVIISSVVPSLDRSVREVLKNSWKLKKLHFVTFQSCMPITLKVDKPREVGSDRICNMVAAWSQFKKPVVIVDFGTATTLEYVDQAGVYRGGLIALGLKVSKDSLSQRAAKLPKVQLGSPKKMLGTNTVSQMQAGIVLGYVEMIHGILKRVFQEIGFQPKLIFTGGLSSVIHPYIHYPHDHDPNLTLTGLYLLAQWAFFNGASEHSVY